ncbi:MAG: dephospho-CoA kinase [Coriobacteriia bacterium]|nr:dephospho-CoA kinase [Coriobacteriia bacterium]
MYVLAVTGGIGSGKSVAAQVLAERGAVVIDLDSIAKELLEPEMPVFRHIINVFGDGVLGADGRIDPAALADAAFASDEAARALNMIVHPAVYAVISGALDALAAQAEPPRLVVLDIPLLVEAPLFLELVDGVLAISASEDARISRCLARGMAEEDVHRRIERQAGDAERRGIADHVIENDGDLTVFKQDVAHFFEVEVGSRVW